MSDDQLNAEFLEEGMPGAEPPSMPLLPDFGANASQYSPPANPNRRRVFVGVLVVVGAALGIVAMRFIGLGAATVLAAITVDLNRADIQTVEVPEELMQGLDRSRRAVQVPAALVDREPFALQAATAAAAPAVNPEELLERERLRQEALARQAAEQREAAINAAIAGLEVQSVMGGSRPVARINGTVVQAGSKVSTSASDVTFVVESITGRQVILALEHRRWALELGGEGPQRLPGR